MSSSDLIEVRMVRHDLADVPRVPVPVPYTLRRYRPGDVETWVRIHRAAEPYHGDISPELFLRQFGADEELLAARQFFLDDGGGAAVGTATAWSGHGDWEAWGRIHWVAVVPEAQGRGLGKVLVSALCQRFVELGHRRAYLTTETVRLPAIRMYRGFGFVPDIRTEEEARIWREIHA